MLHQIGKESQDELTIERDKPNFGVRSGQEDDVFFDVEEVEKKYNGRKEEHFVRKTTEILSDVAVEVGDIMVSSLLSVL